jgi:hypothetical protein
MVSYIYDVGTELFSSSPITSTTTGVRVQLIGGTSTSGALTTDHITTMVTKFDTEYSDQSLTVLEVDASFTTVEAFPVNTFTEIHFLDGDLTLASETFVQSTKLLKLKLPLGLLLVPDRMCESLSTLVDVTLPDSITTLGMHAFDGCSSLTTITLPAALLDMGDHVFSMCKGLLTVDFPHFKGTELGHGVFQHCDVLEKIELPDGITTLKDMTFDSCPLLHTVTFPNTLKTVGVGTFGVSTVSLVELTMDYDLAKEFMGKGLNDTITIHNAKKEQILFGYDPYSDKHRYVIVHSGLLKQKEIDYPLIIIVSVSIFALLLVMGIFFQRMMTKRVSVKIPTPV